MQGGGGGVVGGFRTWKERQPGASDLDERETQAAHAPARADTNRQGERCRHVSIPVSGTFPRIIIA